MANLFSFITIGNNPWWFWFAERFQARSRCTSIRYRPFDDHVDGACWRCPHRCPTRNLHRLQTTQSRYQGV